MLEKPKCLGLACFLHLYCNAMYQTACVVHNIYRTISKSWRKKSQLWNSHGLFGLTGLRVCIMCWFPKCTLKADVFLDVSLSWNCSFKFSCLFPLTLPAHEYGLSYYHHGISRNISSFQISLWPVLKIIMSWGWRDGPEVKGICSCRASGFGSQHQHGGSQPSLTPALKNPMPSSDSTGIKGLHVCRPIWYRR